MSELYVWAETEDEAFRLFAEGYWYNKQKALDSRKFYDDDAKLFKMILEEVKDA